jgi:ABC-type lipoprotein release transport system permease subunit
MRASGSAEGTLSATRPLAIRREAGPSSRGVETRVQLIGVEPAGGRAALAGPCPAVEGRFLRHSDEIVLGGRAAAALGASPGDAVVVEVPVECGADVPAGECVPSRMRFAVAGIVSADPGLLEGRFGLVASRVVSGDIAALSPSAVAVLEADQARAVAALARGAAGAAPPDEVLAWYDLAPEIRTMVAVFEASPVFMVIIIFFAVAIGIVNTMLMATFERVKELGTLKALGMRPSGVVALIVAESAALALVGIAIGTAIGAAVVGVLSATGLDMSILSPGAARFTIAGVVFDPVFWPRIGAADIAKTAVPVAILTTLAGLWPAVTASRIEVVEALRHE